MSLPVNPAVSQPRVVSLPQVQKIVQDVTDCVHQLKEEFVQTRTPITDDCQVLQRFCAKLEHLMQYEMKERFSLLGKRKDYWDYFCECLASTRGSNDGIKYVKSLGESKTSLGKGRAFIRFALVHQRLADSIQQCVIHPKTSEWYNLGSVWVQPKLSSFIIGTLYDLNDLHFDLSPRGYDLDNAWPSFARKSSGSQNWNIPSSRRSSITSMDTVSLSVASTDPDEISRLQQELVSAETARSALAETVGTLEQERRKAEQSVWMTQGELSAMQEQLKMATTRNTQLLQQLSQLHIRYDELQTEKDQQAEDFQRCTAQLDTQQQQLTQEQQQVQQQEQQLKERLAEEKSHCQAQVQSLQSKIESSEEERHKLASKLASLEESLKRMREWEWKKDQQIAQLEQRNGELTMDLDKHLANRKQDATTQLDLAGKYQEVLSRLTEVKTENVQLQALLADIQHKCEVQESSVHDERTKQERLLAQLLSEQQKSESLAADVRKQTESYEHETRLLKEKLDSLVSEVASAQKEIDEAKAELEERDRGLEQSSQLASFVCQTLVALSEVAGADARPPDVFVCTDTDITRFVEACKETAADQMSRAKGQLESLERESVAVNEQLQQSLAGILKGLTHSTDRLDCGKMDLTQLTHELQTRVQALGTELSDLTADRNFLKEQLQHAQGEHSDKGKQLSHLEGRLLELEKVVKESRTAESSLQGQVASLEVALKSEESKSHGLNTQLQAAMQDVAEKVSAINVLQAEKEALETKVKASEDKAERQCRSVEQLTVELTASRDQVRCTERTVEELQAALFTVKGQLANRYQQLQDGQHKLSTVEEECERLKMACISLEHKISARDLDLQSVQQQLMEAEDNICTLTLELEGERTSKTELTKEIERLRGEGARLEEALQEKDAELGALEQVVIGLQQAKEELTLHVEVVQREAEQSKGQVSQLNTSLQAEQAAKQTVINEKEAVTLVLEETRAVLLEKKMTFSSEIQNLHSQLDTFRAQKEEIQKSAHFSQEEKTHVLLEKQSVIDNLEDRENLERQVQHLLETNTWLQQAVSDTEVQLVGARQAVEREKGEAAERIKQLQLQQEEAEQKLREQNDCLSAKAEQLTVELQSKMMEVEEARVEKDMLRSESERLQSDSATEKSELEDSLEKLQSRFSELQTWLDAVIKEKEDLSTAIIAMQEEMAELKADLAASADGYNFLLQSSQKVQEEKEMEAAMLKSQLAELQDSHSQLSSQLNTAMQEQNALKERAQILLSEKQVLTEAGVTLKKNLAEKTQEVESMKQLVQSLTNSISLLEKDDQSRHDELDQLQTTLKEQESSFTLQIEALQQELSALQFQLSAEQLQHEESVKAMGSHQNTLTEMSARLAEQENLIAQLEGELSALKMGWEKERGNQNQQLDELRSLLKAKEIESKHLQDMLQRKSDKLEETLSAAELYQKENAALRKSLDQDIEEREVEIHTLRSDNKQLKKQLIKVVREKAALWQQTDELAFEHKRKAGEKWMDNSAAAKCMGCSAEFSLFLRKHHCRLCGRIFCWNCSNNWVDSPSSSHKARACKHCYGELRNLDASVARASLLPEFSDEDESNIGSDASSRHSSQADNRSTSSLQQAASPPANSDMNSSPASSTDDIYNTTNDGNRCTDDPFTDPTSTSTPTTATASPSSAAASESESQDSAFQVITQEEVTKSLAAYDESAAHPSLVDVPNMSSSMLLSAEDLATGEINRQSEMWVKAGHSFAVPVAIDAPYTIIRWEFTVQPKDIQFSITYHYDDQQPVSQAEPIMAPTRCNSVKEPVCGELTAKKPGIYTLIFDNSYSRMTAKKIHYQLKYDGVG